MIYITIGIYGLLIIAEVRFYWLLKRIKNLENKVDVLEGEVESK